MKDPKGPLRKTKGPPPLDLAPSTCAGQPPRHREESKWELPPTPLPVNHKSRVYKSPLLKGSGGCRYSASGITFYSVCMGGSWQGFGSKAVLVATCPFPAARGQDEDLPAGWKAQATVALSEAFS